MGRKKKPNEQAPAVVSEPTPEGQMDLVQEIEARTPPVPFEGHNGGPPLDDAMREVLGGLSPDDYAAGVYQGVQDALGDADVYMVGRVLDETLADYLHVMKETEGRRAAQEVALRFAETILPYARIPEVTQPYKRLLKP